jgi:hypothetical protein
MDQIASRIRRLRTLFRQRAGKADAAARHASNGTAKAKLWLTAELCKKAAEDMGAAADKWDFKTNLILSARELAEDYGR